MISLEYAALAGPKLLMDRRLRVFAAPDTSSMQKPTSLPKAGCYSFVSKLTCWSVIQRTRYLLACCCEWILGDDRAIAPGCNGCIA
jgi:hypothetical protein